MILCLDPRSQDQVTVGVSDGVRKPRFFVYERNDKISLLEFITKKLPTTTDDLRLTTVFVVPGPGGFSNVRSAVTVANALGFALNIPVTTVKPKAGESPEQIFNHGLILTKRAKPGALVQPIYGKEPHITVPVVTRQ